MDAKADRERRIVLKQREMGISLKKSTDEILKIANQVESSGVGFFDRSGNDMNIWIRDNGNGSGAANADMVARAVGSSKKFDNQSGHWRIQVKDAYK